MVLLPFAKPTVFPCKALGSVTFFSYPVAFLGLDMDAEFNVIYEA